MNSSRAYFKRLIALVVAAALLSGCASSGISPNSGQVGEAGSFIEYESVHSGDYIVVHMHDGSRAEGTVGTIWERALEVGGTKVWKQDMSQIFRARNRDDANAVGLLVFGLIVATIVYISVDLCCFEFPK